MAAKTIDFLMITPEKIVFQKQVVSVIVPTTDGFRGVLADHAPFAGKIVPGPISMRSSDGNEESVVCPSNGFVEVCDNKFTILLPTAA